MTGAISGVGALMRYYTGTVWASIGEVTNISGPTMSRDTIDVTSLASQGGYREFITGIRDPGTLTFTMWYNRTDYEQMKTLFESDSINDFELVLPDATKTSLEFSGYVTELPLDVPEGAVSCNVSIKISGQVVVESGSGS